MSVVLFASAAESVLLFPQSVTFHGIDWRAETANRSCPEAKRKENVQRQIADQTTMDLSSCANSCATSFTICYALFVTRGTKSFGVSGLFDSEMQKAAIYRENHSWSLFYILYFSAALPLFTLKSISSHLIKEI